MTDHHDEVPDAPERQPAGRAGDTSASDEPSSAIDAAMLGVSPHRRDTASTSPDGPPSASGRPDQPEPRYVGGSAGTAGNPHARGVGSLIREALPAALLVLLLAVAVVPVVYAVTWNSEATPLRVTGYGSIGDGYGTFTVDAGADGTRFRVSSEQKLTYNADNHKVWTQVRYQTNETVCIQIPWTSCSRPFSHWRWGSTEATPWGWFVLRKHDTSPNHDADRARALIRMRLHIPWRPDPASGWTYAGPIDY